MKIGKPIEIKFFPLPGGALGQFFRLGNSFVATA